MISSRLSAIAMACLVAWISPVLAEPLEPPTGKIVLVVSGQIEKTNGDGVAAFDLAMLEKLEGRSANMETPWTKGDTRFSGPFLREVLKAVGARGTVLRFKALNDYEVSVPVRDAETLDTILATKMNGSAMSVRDKGPLFLLYPFDLDPDLYTELYYSRSIWQIEKLEVAK